MERNGEAWGRLRGGKGVQGKARPVQERETEGSQCHGSTTCSRPRLGERSVGPHAPHSSRCPCRSCPCSCRASPCHLLLALDYVVLRRRRPSRARWQARVDTKGERRHESRRHASVPSPIPRWPRRSRSHGRRRVATRAGGGRVSSDVYVLESEVVSCCLCREECVLHSFSFCRISALHEMKLVYNLF